MNTPPQTSDANPSPCPTCRTAVPTETTTFPFCCDRCKQIDLGRWFNESYKVSRPIEQADLDEE